MRSTRRQLSRAEGESRQGSVSAAESMRYLARGRVRFLTVSDGGRSAMVMVGPLRGPEHRDLIRRARFYHVPVSAIAASRTGVAYIAFYEGASRFPGQPGLIREYAAVLGVSRVPRCDLPGVTWAARGAADALYYRFDLGPIQPLPRPITNPDRFRVAFRFPDLDRLRTAETLRDLGSPGSRDPRPRARRTRSRKEPGDE